MYVRDAGGHLLENFFQLFSNFSEFHHLLGHQTMSANFVLTLDSSVLLQLQPTRMKAR